MHKVVLAPCTIIVLLLTTLAVSGADQVVTDKDGGFQVTFPEAWTIIKEPLFGGPAQAKAKLIPGTKVEAAVMGIAGDEKKNVTLKEFVDGMYADFGKFATNFKIVEKQEVKLAGTQACRVTYVADVASGYFEDSTLNMYELDAPPISQDVEGNPILYNYVRPIYAGATGIIGSSDSPYNIISDNWKNLQRMDTFKWYLVYRPFGLGSKCVTIGRLDWGWSAYAYHSTLLGQWVSPTTSDIYTHNPHGSKSTDIPEWDSAVQDNSFHFVPTP